MNVSAVIENIKKSDMTIWFVLISLSVISLLAVYSSSISLAIRNQDGNTEYYLMKHSFILIFGLFIAYFMQMINHKYFSSIAKIFVILSAILLLFTLFFGKEVNEARRWIEIPVINLSFQTSDFAKLALIMFTSRTLAVKQGVIKDFKDGFLPLIVPIIVICGLIMFENMSTALLLFSTNILIMFLGRVNMKFISATIIAGIFAAAAVIAISYMNKGRAQTWINRTIEFINSDPENPAYQTLMANTAIAKGGVFRFAPGKCEQCNRLPEAYSDFIFATIIEEYGMTGAAFVIFLYLLLLYRVTRIVRYSPRIFSALMALGLCVSLVMQAFINMMVAVGLLPVTGLTLPFVSMGGTSFWFNSIAVGIILSVSRYIKEVAPEYSQQKSLKPALNV